MALGLSLPIDESEEEISPETEVPPPLISVLYWAKPSTLALRMLRGKC